MPYSKGSFYNFDSLNSQSGKYFHDHIFIMQYLLSEFVKFGLKNKQKLKIDHSRSESGIICFIAWIHPKIDAEFFLSFTKYEFEWTFIDCFFEKNKRSFFSMTIFDNSKFSSQIIEDSIKETIKIYYYFTLFSSQDTKSLKVSKDFSCKTMSFIKIKS